MFRRKQERARLDFLAKLNEEHLRTHPGEEELTARIASYELAFRMQMSAPEVVDLADESPETHKLYGLDNKQTEYFGRQCLLARRLVERGVRFVQLYSGGSTQQLCWDAHFGLKPNHDEHCAETDRPIYGLLTDLKRRGLLDSTLVIWGGEFGRLPTNQGTIGRDHGPKGFTMWLAGGGVKGGQIHGATDEFGYAAVEKPNFHSRSARHLFALVGPGSQTTDFPPRRPRHAADRCQRRSDSRNFDLMRVRIAPNFARLFRDAFSRAKFSHFARRCAQTIRESPSVAIFSPPKTYRVYSHFGDISSHFRHVVPVVP